MVSGHLNAENLLESVTQELRVQMTHRDLNDPIMIGIRTGGVWLAERLHAALNLSSPLGVLDISFYRDDFSQSGLNPKVQPTQLPCPTEGRDLILVDDVIMSGRTIRAAMNELFDYGRPASILLVTLIDLQHRHLPIQPDVVGERLTLGEDQQIKLSGPFPLALEIRNRS
ncbi:bifunctional pyr operon transcriptional regulator/uracil phosphoribosyltransferase PyrR [Nitrincola tibetensis]|uniref:Bifunctional pyr operon transcriptional regulator/uracil phosphoribosyltransferase PyrR n=1 Tax=Nitrincola tibetensis TaxID=2219697 RepID=A0A364NP50_9GAMM|nr:bifunctional pyr operon transcriptional regulator/uracil phosphoribosyltransferase PyrR [Nitrincola tibetensis]RAU18802.1 bifunctional pyr operon transcriptional regulator/uracil phosphoribosyltransferase PyrR [Nitrincola tibetensis]